MFCVIGENNVIIENNVIKCNQCNHYIVYIINLGGRGNDEH